MQAAMITIAGMDPIKFLDTVPGSTEWCVRVAIAQRVLQQQETRDDNLAIKIANAVGKMLGG